MREAVVVPVYNGRATLPQCPEGLLAQSREPEAVYVVDNGSTDGTWGVLRQFAARHPRVRAVREERRGPAAARNAGIRAAWADGKPEFLAFTDADCVPARDWLGRLRAGFDHGRVGAVVGRIVPRVREGLVGSYLRLSAFDPASADRVATSVALEEGLAGGNACVRTRALEQVGLFDESLRVAQDWDLGLRLLRVGWWVRYTTQAVVDHLHLEQTVADLLQLAAKYARGRPAILTRHFPHRTFLFALGRRVELRGPLTGSVGVSSPEKVALALCALAVWAPWAWSLLGAYGVHLSLRLRKSARGRGVKLPLWQLPLLVGLELLEAAAATARGFQAGLRQGVLCL